ncbi:MAG: rare lipoprotein [Fibrobacteres bacterium]|nr:rare lipoprotein [Fibrobacterota bacterium]
MITKTLTSTEKRLSLMALSSLLLGACAFHPGPDRPGYDRDMGQYPEATRSRSSGFEEQGKISYYAEKFHGRRTASGAIFNKNAMTAAHRSLPFRTKVEVTNLDNGKSVVVEINDRGPYSEDRILDVSPAAARKLGLLGKGTANAKLVVQ